MPRGANPCRAEATRRRRLVDCEIDQHRAGKIEQRKEVEIGRQTEMIGNGG